jgi:small subunit ribosomal protein S8
MSMTDPLADMLTRIRNGSKARRVAVDIPASKIKRELARILVEEKFARDIVEIPDNKQGIIRLYLKYSKDDEPIIKGLRRLSRPSLRRYIGVDELRRTVNSQVGITIVSTSRGIMTGAHALEQKIGGEALCNIW